MALVDPFEEQNAGLIDPFEQVHPEEVKPQPPEESFLSGVGESASKRIGNVGDIYSKNVPSDESMWDSFKKVPPRILQTAGQAAGFINDVALEGIKAGYRNLVPQEAQKYIEEKAGDVLSNPAVQSGVKTLSDAYAKAKETFPEGMRNVEAVANIAGAIPVLKGTQVAGKVTSGAVKGGINTVKEGRNIIGDIATSIAPQSEDVLSGQIDRAVRYGVEKAIRPSVAGKATAGQTNKYFSEASDAVKNIVNNRDNLMLTDVDGNIVRGKLPSSLKQFSEAIDQTKKNIFKEYDSLAKTAGDKGAVVNLDQTAKELKDVIDSPIIKDLHPETAKYAERRMKALSRRKEYTTEQTQDAISILNKSLESFYRNPSYENATKASIDALIANNMRKSLDKTIEQATGEGYQKLKNSYGSLKTIEKDVAHRSAVDARRNIHGLIDFTDIFTSGELLAGIATMNPSMMLRAGAWKGVKEYFKHINNPNRIVKVMFGDVENILNRSKAGYKSKTFNYLAGRPPVYD